MNTLRLFTPSALRTLPLDLFDHFLTNSMNESNTVLPHTNILEENDKFLIEIALPGFSKEQISMNYFKNVLTVKSVNDENSVEDKKYLSREFGYRSFTKQFTISRMLDAEAISAEFINGILRITVPKKEEARVKEPVAVQIK